MSSIPRVAIVGRPNVGKSTLFNRLFGRKRALVHDLPGVTRDRLEETTEWTVGARTFPIRLIDTGGLGGEKFTDEIARQVSLALSEAEAVIVLWDGQTGLTPQDEEVISLLQTRGVLSKKPVIGAVNKVDEGLHEGMAADFYSTGIETIIEVSAEHARGIQELQEAVTEGLEKAYGPEIFEAKRAEPEMHRIAILGRPNVGKSTLTNALLEEERMITSPIAGTTVDSVDSVAMLGGQPFVLIDTAGIRRKAKTEQGVEVLSVVQAKKALERCDVAILLLDGEAGITDQDEKIGGLIEQQGVGVILAVNKWDTQKKNQDFTTEVAAGQLRKMMGFLNFAPVIFISAKKRQGLDKIPMLVNEILEQRKVKLTTHEFTEWVRREAEIHNPMNVKFFMSHQVSRHPPTFVCHVSNPDKVHFSLRRHLVNALRERWGFMGNPVKLLFVSGKSARSPRK